MSNKKKPLLKKGKAYKGWLIPYTVVLDTILGSGRWKYWLECLVRGEIPQEPLPKLKFAHVGAKEKTEATKHLHEAIYKLGRYRGNWDGLRTLLHWILWGLGASEFPKDMKDEEHEWLYKFFNVGLLLKAPHDYFGDIIAERLGNGWNPNAFYPTPLHVAIMMGEMTCTGDPSGKGIFQTVMEPCVGTGRMLLAVSDKSVFLRGQDVDPMVLDVCRLNAELYIPWMALPVQEMEKRPFYRIPAEVTKVARARLAFAQQLFDESHEISELLDQEKKPEKKKNKRKKEAA